MEAKTILTVAGLLLGCVMFALLCVIAGSRAWGLRVALRKLLLTFAFVFPCVLALVAAVYWSRITTGMDVAALVGVSGSGALFISGFLFRAMVAKARGQQ